MSVVINRAWPREHRQFKSGLLQRGFAVILATAPLLTCAGWVSAQRVIEIRDPASCDCEIRIERWTTISDEDGRAGLASPQALARTRDGQYLVVPSIDQGTLLLFDVNGRYVRTIGRSGPGPWEYKAILALEPGPGDSTYVLDTGNARVTILDPHAQPVRSVQLPIMGGQFAVMSDGSILILGAIDTRSAQPADRLRHVDASGQIVRSFMPQPAIDPSTSVFDARRRISASPEGTIAATHFNEYVIEMWNVAGGHTATLVRDVPWFPRGRQAGRPPDDPRGRPNPNLEAARFDDEGRLWTLAQVADQEWTKALASVPGQGGRTRLGVPTESSHAYMDSVIEVLDTQAGTLLAAIQVDERMMLLTGGFAASYRQDEGGNPFIDVWKLELVRK